MEEVGERRHTGKYTQGISKSTEEPKKKKGTQGDDLKTCSEGWY